MPELAGLGAGELGTLVGAGEITARESVEAHLERASELNGALNAITDLQGDRARELASEADRRLRTQVPRALEGVPVTVKSSIAARGFKHECGSELRLGEAATQDAAVVRSLRQAGAIVIGTTNVPEFLMAYETDNAIYGRTNSPFDRSVTPGGSSGGCSAAVASGMSAASFGSDGGGSVRVPAHFCGLYGFKPSPGFIPRSGHWPGVAGPSVMLAGVGPLARTAADLAMLVHITARPDQGEITSLPVWEPAMPTAGESREMRVGWFDHAWDTPVTRETRQAVRLAARSLAERGFRVERVDLKGLERTPEIWWLMFGVCLKTLIQSSIPADYRLHRLAHDAMASDAEEAQTSYEELLQGWVVRDMLRMKLAEHMRRHQLLLCPVASIPAFRHGERRWNVDGQVVEYPGAFVYSQVFNVLGVPAATVPVTRTDGGLPIGVQLAGPPFQDMLVMDAVRELAAALGQP